MTIYNYIGVNVPLPYSDDNPDIQEVKKHFSTKYVYDLTNEIGSLWFNERYREDYSVSNTESQNEFIELCEFLKRYLKKGDYCEIYTCWNGYESEEVEYRQTIMIDNIDVNKINIFEGTLLVIKK